MTTAMFIGFWVLVTCSTIAVYEGTRRIRLRTTVPFAVALLAGGALFLCTHGALALFAASGIAESAGMLATVSAMPPSATASASTVARASAPESLSMVTELRVREEYIRSHGFALLAVALVAVSTGAGVAHMQRKRNAG